MQMSPFVVYCVRNDTDGRAEGAAAAGPALCPPDGRRAGLCVNMAHSRNMAARSAGRRWRQPPATQPPKRDIEIFRSFTENPLKPKSHIRRNKS